MSRNLQYKSNTTSTKQPSQKKPMTTEDSSSEDGYDGVDDITDDSDGEEPDVEAAEARLIIEEDNESQPTPRPNPVQDEASSEISWNGFEEDDQPLGLYPQSLESGDDGKANEGDAPPATSEAEEQRRRVRFEVEDSDSSTTMSDDDDYDFNNEYPWPEPFVSVSNLDPSFRRQIEQDDDELLSIDGSFWDFDGTEDQTHHQIEENIPSDVSQGSESDSQGDESGYETDCGETTEEEDVPVKHLPTSSVLLNHPNPWEIDSDEEDEIVHRSNPNTPRTLRAGDRKGPKLGSFEQLPERPWARFDFKSKRLLMFRAKIVPGRYSSDDTPNNTPLYRQRRMTTELSPMISNSANIMMGALFTQQGQLIEGNVLGPPEAYFPYASVNVNGEVSHDTLDEDSSQDSSPSFDERDIDEANSWKLDDLVYLGSSDEEDDQEQGEGDDMFATPRPTTATTSSEDQSHPLLLSNPGLVGSFRNNQDRHKLLSGGNNVTADSMRFSSRFNTTAIQGIRNGHLNAARTPMTPSRKQKASQLDSSPLASQNKRKFSGDQRGHKRSKSLH